VYKGTCQYCYEKIPYSQATKDHAIPKSKGGTNDDFNLVLACRECNNRKDSIYPFYDVNGKEVKPKKLQSFAFVPDVNNVREEWKPYLIESRTYV
jgi:5-methylcytosine-specific restriction endonuclease McrA